jgi:hypothetical protein
VLIQTKNRRKGIDSSISFIFPCSLVAFIRAMQNDFVCHLFVSLLQSIVENEKVLSSLKTTARIYSCFSSFFNTSRYPHLFLAF